MVARHLLHYRPSAEFTRDLIPSPSEPFLTAPREPALRAMEELVWKHERIGQAQTVGKSGTLGSLSTN
ncbi:hypothetical protein MJO28_005728 [Puccinia striiformis f. sp. tritici]|uniref:Uncharacterized protein n=1 Tax=Puccinia striiformis f. sp. tritici TaxID=168172 RepID=A0ACC0ELI8_9BASI|nr:hypothetical protein MJO28_005728 [Puccinia striiformis f. sp. tritici]